MQDNGTVHQLSKALNQLLDAYEVLQEESKNIKEENLMFKEEIGDLELRNRGLESRLSALNDTTELNSNEMDTMLGRIENILGSTVDEVEKEEENIIENIVETPQEEDKVIEPVVETLDNQTYQNKNDNKEIDLGRMQSLLNGFGNN